MVTYAAMSGVMMIHDLVPIVRGEIIMPIPSACAILAGVIWKKKETSLRYWLDIDPSGAVGH